MASYTTERKISFLKDKFGDDWETIKGEKSLDKFYKENINDHRESLYCKINKETKNKFDEMVDHYGVKNSYLLQSLIDKHYTEFVKNKSEKITTLTKDFSGQ